MDEKTGLWNDVGDKKAREKTSQALRERAPQIRQELEKERIARERKERGESTEEEDVRIVSVFASCFKREELLTILFVRFVYSGR
jgi:predicted lipid-binding transport protein (Tim44 family)